MNLWTCLPFVGHRDYARRHRLPPADPVAAPSTAPATRRAVDPDPAALRAGALMVPTLPLALFSNVRSADDAQAAQLTYCLLESQIRAADAAKGQQPGPGAAAIGAKAATTGAAASREPITVDSIGRRRTVQRRRPLAAVVGACVSGAALHVQRQRCAARPDAPGHRWVQPVLWATAVGLGAVAAAVPLPTPPRRLQRRT